ncbi:MAG: hypothetical protein U9R56_07085, partial [candidate division Zixibacteria bacterium]|nr:hypothetical protein [candidate division Zixibacteria bacterium]
MMKTAILFACVVLLFTAGISASSIYSLIMNGDIESAADSLSKYSTASLRDGNVLFCAGLLQADAEESVRLMEAALNVSVAAVYREQIYYRRAQYYFIKKDYDKLHQITTDYHALWETGRYGKDMQRYSILINEMSDKYESALRQADRYYLLYGYDDDAQWGKIDKARVMLRNHKRIGAGNILRKLSREKSGPGVPQALYLLALDAASQSRTDDAVLYY